MLRMKRKKKRPSPVSENINHAHLGQKRKIKENGKKDEGERFPFHTCNRDLNPWVLFIFRGPLGLVIRKKMGGVLFFYFFFSFILFSLLYFCDVTRFECAGLTALELWKELNLSFSSSVFWGSLTLRGEF